MISRGVKWFAVATVAFAILSVSTVVAGVKYYTTFSLVEPHGALVLPRSYRLVSDTLRSAGADVASE
jgi:hypothetical protein